MMRTFLLHDRSLPALQQLIESTERAKHRRLPPVQGRGLVHKPSGIAAIIEITSPVLHMLNRPLGDFQRQRQTFRIEVVEENERVNRL